EILGKAETDLGRGVVQHVDEKFSTGKMLQANSALKAGDRTRYHEAPKTSGSGMTPAPASDALMVPKELWRSEPIRQEAMGLAIGDVDGDGKKEMVVAFRDHVELYRWSGQALESAGVFKPRGYGNYLAVETGDLEGQGRDAIFASLVIQGVKRSKAFVVEY